ncbi:HD domain-containing protein [Acidipropionibacterium jensenii]|uniref:HD domain-containing protein n=1 Tax=Acidipropionibacterium jensenii TaxID=1749 RepID=UPI000BC2EC1A|nr:HD domain-containing protein [Acidipropionibacterium jensenii]AZZ41155.1 HD domain-containing protein [Acidipropionibacterium jensenii]
MEPLPARDAITPEVLARWAHQGQRRDTPAGLGAYIDHPRRVVELLLAGGVADPEVLAAGWLHDTVEDQPGRLVRAGSALDCGSDGGAAGSGAGVGEPVDDAVVRVRALAVLADLFGPTVARIVAEVTNPLPSSSASLPSESVAASSTQGSPDVLYLEHLRQMCAHGSPAAVSVKICDHLDNTRDLDPVPADPRDPARLARLRRKYAAARPILRSASSLLASRWQASTLSRDLTQGR